MAEFTLKHHRFLIGLTAILILIIGLGVGNVLASNLETADLDAIQIALTFTAIILVLLIGSFVLEVREMLQAKKGKK